MSMRLRAIGPLAVLLLISGAAAAQAQPQTIERKATSLSGGKIETEFAATGRASAETSLEYTDAQNAKQAVVVKAGQRVEIRAASATVASATAEGGKLELPVNRVDAQSSTATVASLSGATLKGAVVTVKPVSTSQTIKVDGKEYTGAFKTEVSLADVQVGGVTVKDAQIPLAALKGDDLGATTQATTDWVGDYVVLKIDGDRFIAVGTTGPMLVAPRGACFHVFQEVDKPDPSDPTKKITYLRGNFVTGWFPALLMPPWKCPTSLGEVRENKPYEVQKKWLVEEMDRSRYGWTYGVLVAPFKYYWRADRQFSAGASVGPYVGYRLLERPGSSTIGAIAIGAAAAQVKATDANGNETTTTRTGLTIAYALISQFKDFNAGFIAGRDFFSKADNIPLSGRVWLSVSFGKKLD